MVSVPGPADEFIEIRKVIGPGPERADDGPGGQKPDGSSRQHAPLQNRSIVAEPDEQKRVNGQQIAYPVLNGVEEGKIGEQQRKRHDQIEFIRTPWYSQPSPGDY